MIEKLIGKASDWGLIVQDRLGKWHHIDKSGQHLTLWSPSIKPAIRMKKIKKIYGE